jgi:AAA domain
MKRPDVRGSQYDYCTTCGADLTVMDHLDWCTDEYRAANKLCFDGEKWVSASSTPNGEGVYLVKASMIEPEDVDYFEENLIPLKVVTLITGLDGVGKSTILYAKAALATRGELPGAFEGAPVDVVVASSEDHPNSVIVPRLIAAGADLDRVHVVKVNRDGLTGDIALPDDLDAVALEVGRVGARLLIVDPLVAHMPLNIDSHKAQHVRQVLAPLARLAEERNLAVAAVVHFNGAPSTDVRSRISGSKALRDASRSVLVCGIDPDDESRFVLVQDKFSFGPKPTTGTAYRIDTAVIDHKAKTFKTSRVLWLGEVEISATGLLAGPEDPDARSERDEAVEFLVQLLKGAGGSMPAKAAKQAARDADIAERTLTRARQRAGISARRTGFPAESLWVLPDRDVQSGQSGQPQDAGPTGPTDKTDTAEQLLRDELGAREVEDVGAYTSDDYEDER